MILSPMERFVYAVTAHFGIDAEEDELSCDNCSDKKSGSCKRKEKLKSPSEVVNCMIKLSESALILA